ncbi:MAG: molecular chaperone DnaJ [Paenibacillus macerans]|uniref:molecular chaperone DnaJ n=1 Tax=Paenibacillus macerans TaxID=44252 RepID=UPI00290F36CA|nr:molecular chaperone DnaJ [Paenibacillus macerans]MDU7477135.1 molecular chaperone DnaJ [Paenibacillus macerans]
MEKDILKQAYEQLGLPENAPREDVDKAFDILLRKSRSRQQDDRFEQEYEAKVKAYKMIIEAEERSKVEEMSRQRYAKWGKFAGTAEKIDDFFRLYKTHCIIALVAVIAIVFGLNAYLDHREEQKRLAALPPVDLSIIMVGNFLTDEANGGTDALEQAMTAQIPDFKRLELEMLYLPGQSESGMSGADMAYQQKALAVIATSSPDIYITDKASFDWLSGGGAFLSLDKEAAELKPLLTDDRILKAKSEEDGQEHVYGIDVTGSALADQLPLAKQQMIISLRADTPNADKALKMIREYLEHLP